MADESESEALQSTLLKCSHCDKTGRFMKLCTQCRAVLYCSRECQINDWPSHKKMCSKLKSEILEEKKKVKGIQASNASEIMNDEKQPEQQHTYYPQNIDRKQEINKEDGKISSSSKGSKPTENCKNSMKKYNTSSLDLNDESKSIPQRNGDVVTIFIKHNKEKKKAELVKNPDDSISTFQQISDFLRIPVGKLKLIHKGKMVLPENVNTFLTNNGALFLAFGEVSECEDGLDKNDIDLLIKQLNVERNVAVKALRRTGTLLDAIFDIGNKL